MNRKRIASCIDHTLLKPNAGFTHINQICREANIFGFHSVCVNPWLVKEAAKNLNNSPVKICSVAGFPLGANTTMVKLKEIETCLHDGATEIGSFTCTGSSTTVDITLNNGDYTVLCTSGRYPAEISWNIEDSDGNIVDAADDPPPTPVCSDTNNKGYIKHISKFAIVR